MEYILLIILAIILLKAYSIHSNKIYLKKKKERLLGLNRKDEYHWYQECDLDDVKNHDIKKGGIWGYTPTWIPRSKPRVWIDKLWSGAPSVWLDDKVVLVWYFEKLIPLSHGLNVGRHFFTKKYRVVQFEEYEITVKESLEINLREITYDTDITHKLQQGDNVYFTERIKNGVIVLKEYKYWGGDTKIDRDSSILLSYKNGPKFSMQLKVFKEFIVKKLIVLERLSGTVRGVEKDTIRLSKWMFYHHLIECRGISLIDCIDIIKKVEKNDEPQRKTIKN